MRVYFLNDELERAELIAPAEIEFNTVAMNSCARIVDPDTGEVRDITLVYPGEEDSVQGKVSIFTPPGAQRCSACPRAPGWTG
jgi:regulator of nucleoside diphosphate kinase